MKRLIRRSMTACLFSLIPVFAIQADEPPPVPDLGERISQFKAQRPAPAEPQRAIMDKAAKDLAEAIPEPGLKVGSHAPDFSLPDAFGNSTRLADVLARGPVILTFYRGRVVKILMRLPDGNISAAHPSVLYSRLIRHHDSLPS